MFKKILVPIDGSENALLAVKYARALAEKFKSKVTLLYVVQNVAFGVPETVDLVIKDLDSTGRDILSKALEIFEGFDGWVSSQLEYGNPGVKIVDLTKEDGYSLIVMGRRGLSGIMELMLGSVSNHVVHHAHCPTLIIKGNEID